ncbi:hypothetical protein BO82DRAFT_49076 [Aspergillus uvarum CBS 121591]|uniref:Uncharacterized protein n=1 Tax=Aspergillus uvarum CBS 121591 TaxID=1448315 RepID=A0A319DV77_9EURO|nr:hypothetical protein BO82DRAFT_49076 [Aspergillus uvarum CBS 121591]PYH82972.1 hypothetical protein BO82DRAFT_49076 [Aspergillus uvarum CBS 121591]
MMVVDRSLSFCLTYPHVCRPWKGIEADCIHIANAGRPVFTMIMTMKWARHHLSGISSIACSREDNRRNGEFPLHALPLQGVCLPEPVSFRSALCDLLTILSYGYYRKIYTVITKPNIRQQSFAQRLSFFFFVLRSNVMTKFVRVRSLVKPQQKQQRCFPVKWNR